VTPPRVHKPRRKKNLTAHEGEVTSINQCDKLNLNIWGDVYEISVISGRISSAAEDFEGAGEPLNEGELAVLNEVLGKDLINSEEIKSVVLKYVNEVAEEWDEDYEEEITSLAYPEVDMNRLIIDKNEKRLIVAFCGDAMCDEEHGISVTFLDGKFAGVGDAFAYEYAPYWDLYDGKERKVLDMDECAELAYKDGYCEKDKFFSFGYVYTGNTGDKNKNKQTMQRTYDGTGFWHKIITVKDGKVYFYNLHDFSEREFKIYFGNHNYNCCFALDKIKRIEIEPVKGNPWLVKKLRVVVNKEKDDKYDGEFIVLAEPQNTDALDRLAEILKEATA
ncbi:MAG: hypothetical protein K2N22_03385, partial [Clostridia bacterium]|nr:hypothetical protein [Clostridia bacterium]